VVAVVIDALTGHDVLAYTNGLPTSCGAPASSPAVVRPNEVVSVGWAPVGPSSTAVRTTMPACAHYYGWTQVTGNSVQPAVQVLASVPFDPLCGETVPQSVDVDDVVPLGTAQNQVPHAALGPTQDLRVLPGG